MSDITSTPITGAGVHVTPKDDEFVIPEGDELEKIMNDIKSKSHSELVQYLKNKNIKDAKDADGRTVCTLF